MVLAEHGDDDLQREHQCDEGDDEGLHLAEHGLDPSRGQVDAQPPVQVVDGDLEQEPGGVDEALRDPTKDVADLVTEDVGDPLGKGGGGCGEWRHGVFTRP